jgi:N-acetylneuraminic acid mutarotase
MAVRDIKEETMSNQTMAKVIVSVGALLVLALGGCGQVSDSVLTAGGPSFPTGMTASPGNGQNVLAWNPVDGATAYNVYWATVSGVNVVTGTRISNITATSYAHTTVTNGIIYYYVVTAVNKDGESSESEQVSAMPSATLGAWTTRASIPTARESMTSSALNGQIYVIDGFSNGNLSLVEAYDPVSNTWTTKQSSTTNTPRYLHTSSVFNGNIYVMGGVDANNNVSSDILQYAPSSNTWTAKTNMTIARSSLASSATNTLIYAIGGWNGSATVNTVEAYDSVANTWTTKASMLTSRYRITSSIVGNVIYVFGGTSSQNGTALTTVEAYDTVLNSWSTKKPMPTAREGMTSSVVNGKIYVIGGFNDDFRILNTVEVYDPVADSWASAAAMPTARNVLASSAINGVIYAIGGFDGFEDLKAVEQFTP